MGVVIPFGKYKGSEVESVRETDSQYLDWLAQQPFLEKFPEIAAAISGATEESPVHNALQAQFLDDDICFQLADHLHHVIGFERRVLGIRGVRSEA